MVVEEDPSGCGSNSSYASHQLPITAHPSYSPRVSRVLHYGILGFCRVTRFTINNQCVLFISLGDKRSKRSWANESFEKQNILSLHIKSCLLHHLLQVHYILSACGFTGYVSVNSPVVPPELSASSLQLSFVTPAFLQDEDSRWHTLIMCWCPKHIPNPSPFVFVSWRRHQGLLFKVKHA